VEAPEEDRDGEIIELSRHGARCSGVGAGRRWGWWWDAIAMPSLKAPISR